MGDSTLEQIDELLEARGHLVEAEAMLLAHAEMIAGTAVRGNRIDPDGEEAREYRETRATHRRTSARFAEALRAEAAGPSARPQRG